MSYEHPQDPLLKNLHYAMEYNDAGEPRLRVNAEGVTITGDVSVDNVTINNTTENPVPTNIQNEVEIKNESGNPISVIGTEPNPWGKQVLLVDDDTVQHTSKNRRKVSNYEIIQFNTFRHGDDTEIWDTQISGGGIVTFDQYMGMMNLQVANNIGDSVIRQTRRVVRYTPGRANEVSMAVKWKNPTVGIRKRFGIFDENNGAYFEDGGDENYYVVCRRNTSSGIVEERVSRNNWNVDKLDGTGPSGIMANPEAIQLMVIEYEWYGAGQVEFKFVIGNNAISVHQFAHANVSETTWSSTPFLPVRAELTNITGVSGIHNFYVGSTSVIAEGDVGPMGIEYNAASPITGKPTGPANTFIPVVSIRIQTNKLDSAIIPLDFQAATLDNTGLFYRLVLNPILTNAVWIPVGNDSCCEYDVSATGHTNGKILKTGYISPTSQGTPLKFAEKVLNQLGRTNLGTVSDVITIEVATTNANKSAFATLNWVEVR